jgi:hypothetical protein
MLTFDPSFHSDDRALGCVLWAHETVMGRVRFDIGSLILQDMLHGRNPVHGPANVTLCERERPRIEAACRHAFAIRPSGQIKLEPSDFNPTQVERPMSGSTT